MNTETPNLTLTDAAIHHIQQQLLKKGHGIGIRLSVKETGCTGYSYLIDLIDEPKTDDIELNIQDGLSIFVAPDAIKFIQGSEIDYIKKGLNYQFEFRNPNVTAMCGCGESFRID